MYHARKCVYLLIIRIDFNDNSFVKYIFSMVLDTVTACLCMQYNALWGALDEDKDKVRCKVVIARRFRQP